MPFESERVSPATSQVNRRARGTPAIYRNETTQSPDKVFTFPNRLKKSERNVSGERKSELWKSLRRETKREHLNSKEIRRLLK